MLSIILKPFLRRGPDIEVPASVGKETGLTLSMMESGCIFVNIEERAALIIKCTGSDMSSIKESDGISLRFEHIDRPEFPSVAVSIEIDAAAGPNFRFEYFFSLESEEEKALLAKLRDQDFFDILYYDSNIEQVRRAALSAEQKKELTLLLDKA